jgi:hypothetical protein
MTYDDFVVLEDAYKPQVVYFVDGVNTNTQIYPAVLDQGPIPFQR